jgi:hypothetical protein
MTELAAIAPPEPTGATRTAGNRPKRFKQLAKRFANFAEHDPTKKKHEQYDEEHCKVKHRSFT